MKIKSTEHVRTKSLILTFYFDLFLLLLLFPDASSFMNVRLSIVKILTLSLSLGGGGWYSGGYKSYLYL